MKTISVPESVSVGLKRFVDDNSIPVGIQVENGDLTVEDTGTERRESTLDFLYSGGWVTCATARAIAANLEITLSQMGQMLDHLNVKVKKCGLGCF